MTVQELDSLIGKRDHLPFLNPRNEIYRELNMKAEPPTRDEAIRLMARHPNLIRRPLLVRGGEILFGFDQAEWERIKS
ncbi:MAG: hypothetical protein HY821_01795 [Acidobacteria bacterium]|nr:hypothetical protein [Acidobacteriota bacterium]